LLAAINKTLQALIFIHHGTTRPATKTTGIHVTSCRFIFGQNNGAFATFGITVKLN
jgi:hypothetical protein